jgi:MinD superfamily P-loop ATPase
MSGKGGTGKTTLTASFAYLSRKEIEAPLAVADADVDAANLHLLFGFKHYDKLPYTGGKKAYLTPSKCTGCTECVKICRFEAIRISNGFISINPLFCEGCNACVRFCKEGAIRLETVHSGWLRYGTALDTVFVDGELFPGEETSGKLVTEVRVQADTLAEKEKLRSILIDGAPGIGCPAISSITATSHVFIVTEPSGSGLHDLERMIATTKYFRIPYSVIINKYNLKHEYSDIVEKKVKEEAAEVIGKIPFDDAVVEASRKGVPVVLYGGKASEAIKSIWSDVVRPKFFESV